MGSSAKKKSYRKYVLGTCVCPICYDMHNIAKRPWLKETMRATVLRAPGCKQRIHCTKCQSNAEGIGTWLWLVHPASDFQLQKETYEKAIGEEFDWESTMESDLENLQVTLASSLEKIHCAKIAGQRGEEDLFCPVCQRTDHDRAAGPSLWIPREKPKKRTPNLQCKCKLCGVRVRGGDLLYSWRKQNSTHSLKKQKGDLNARREQPEPSADTSEPSTADPAVGSEQSAG